MRACLDCGIEVGRSSLRCKSCAAVHRNHLRAEQVCRQLAQARSVPRKKRPKRQAAPSRRLRFDPDAVRTAIYADGKSITDVERICRLPKGTLSETLRKRTMPLNVADKVAVAIGRHYTEFEVSA